MFDCSDQWLRKARRLAGRYAAVRARIDELEAQAAGLLAETIEAYRWPADVPLPSRRDMYGVSHIGDGLFGEDLTCELAVANRTSEGAARDLVADVAALSQHLPECWDRVTRERAPLWQARRIVTTCTSVTADAWPTIDAEVAPALGAVAPGRLFEAVEAACLRADPGYAVRKDAMRPSRCVKTGGVKDDPATGWVYARVERGDAIFFDALIQGLADRLEPDDADQASSQDELRARAFHVMTNPAAAVQVLGVPTTRGMNPAPQTAADVETFIEHTVKLVPAWTPTVQVYVHMADGALDSPLESVVRVELLGPRMCDQLATITKGCKVRLAPVIHAGAGAIGVDQYEIPVHIREQVLLRDKTDMFPWSATPARHLDVDHTAPYRPDKLKQTRPDNLAPLSRHAHRVKTHAGWRVDQVRPGVLVWYTPAGQTAQVDRTGTHPIHRRL